MRSYHFILILQFCHFIKTDGKDIIVKKPTLLRTESNSIVETTNGKVTGLISETIDLGTPYISYRGIPYAAPPIGNLRFRPPAAASNWTGILQAYEDGSSCTQGVPIEGSEDCLFMNVYTPKLIDDGNPLAVLVWIYGGGFIGGDSSYNSFGPDYFLNENLMFVSFNYRVGVFGFLSTEDLESPGNYGLKDQIFALKWIRDNIRNFGGDPDKITIFGESAGAASVSYLLQTPLTAGLFNRAISNSGSSLCQWALTRNPKRYAKAIANTFLINTSNSTNIVNGLRKVPYDQLHGVAFTIQIGVLTQDFLHGLVFSPTIEPPHSGAVLSGKSHEILVNKQYNNVSYLLGFNSKEAAGWLETSVIFNTPISILGAPLLASFDFNNSRLVPVNMNVDRSKLNEVGRAIRNYYFNFLPILLSPIKFESFASDDQFARPTRELARLYSRDVDVYYYRFSYIGQLGIGKDSERNSNAGVSHAEDLLYLFRRNSSRTDVPFADFVTRYRLIRMWANFVKEGNPTPQPISLLQNVIWPITRNRGDSDTNLLYLDIGNDLAVKSNPNEEALKKWQDWYGLYANPTQDTY